MTTVMLWKAGKRNKERGNLNTLEGEKKKGVGWGGGGRRVE